MKIQKDSNDSEDFKRILRICKEFRKIERGRRIQNVPRIYKYLDGFVRIQSDSEGFQRI